MPCCKWKRSPHIEEQHGMLRTCSIREFMELLFAQVLTSHPTEFWGYFVRHCLECQFSSETALQGVLVESWVSSCLATTRFGYFLPLFTQLTICFCQRSLVPAGMYEIF